MYQFITTIRFVIGLMVVMLLNGCTTRPQYPIKPNWTTSVPSYSNNQLNNQFSGFHTVERGETLYRIGMLYGISYQEIAAVNNIYPPYLIQPGQSLQIPNARIMR